MNRHRRKAECIDLVLALRDHGITSATLVSELLQISKTEAWRILNTERRAPPRKDLTDVLGGLPNDLKARVTRFTSETDSKSETVFPDSSAKELKPA